VGDTAADVMGRYGHRPPWGLCALVARDVADEFGGVMVGGWVTTAGGDRFAHWWVVTDGGIVDPMVRASTGAPGVRYEVLTEADPVFAVAMAERRLADGYDATDAGPCDCPECVGDVPAP
jgi:hypothetical protein